MIFQTTREGRDRARDQGDVEGDHDVGRPRRGHVQVHQRSAGGGPEHGPRRIQVVHRSGDAHHSRPDGRAHRDIRPRLSRQRVECEQSRGVTEERVCSAFCYIRLIFNTE